jgi:hypothetical protein
MPGKINNIINLARNMGARYMIFRTRYEVLRRTGLYKKKFPAAPPFKQYISLETWKAQPAEFFFADKESLGFPRQPRPGLKETFTHIRNGKLLLFNSLLTDLGTNYDWATNPDSGFHYNVQKHWTEIADYSKEAGDIKFVWEKSRFSYLYDIIRYDYHFNEDCAEMVFNDILSWIKSNPVNCGPNYRCSQEMSLRVLNWTFALYYYRNSRFLTGETFSQVQYAVYWHLDHIYKNIDFSRIAVRNNHAITETLTLYLAGIFYPSMPGADVWKKMGKQWFEEEIAYQVYEDGTFLQFSMNYHRIVVQLLTWGIVLSEKNGEKFSSVVYDRAKKSLVFLRTCMVEENGWLPNYGANDGALFFKFTTAHYRDYRPQLGALGAAIGMNAGVGNIAEDLLWYGLSKPETNKWEPADGIYSFTKGGYYIIREPRTLTFIRCGSYEDRPSQADNLHLDLWYKGENILPDAGSYKYNTDIQTLRYFTGTASHNTVMLGDKDQMLKGGRFIWYYWGRCREAKLKENVRNYSFTGVISAFTYIDKNILHKRSVVKRRGSPVWEIKDEVLHAPKGMKIKQLWHLPLGPKNKIFVTAKDKDEQRLNAHNQDGWHSSLYGQKESTQEIIFSVEDGPIDTIVRVNG